MAKKERIITIGSITPDCNKCMSVEEFKHNEQEWNKMFEGLNDEQKQKLINEINSYQA